MTAPPLVVPVMTLDGHDPALDLPRHETDAAAGMDLRACLSPEDRIRGLVLPSMGRALVPTGLAIAIPDGFEGQVRPRSGLAIRHGLTVLNSPGTIDADYRGELKVALINLGSENHTISHGDRIAQLIIAPYQRVQTQLAVSLPVTTRGQGGFGSTGKT